MTHTSRRQFLKITGVGAGVLAIGVILPDVLHAETTVPKFPHEPLAFVRINADDTVTVVVKHLDKGQGVATGLSTIVAEELDADWAQMRSEFSPSKAPLYANRAFGIQGTGGSSSINNSWDELRYSGAAIRAMLIDAAAHQWKVLPSEVTVDKGVVRHLRSNRHATFGSLAAKAAQQPVPQEVVLKSPDQFKLIGNAKLHRLDSVDKTTGKAKYTLDVRRPGMVRAVIARSPKFGGKVRSFDATAAKAIKGVVDVVQVTSGVAVLAVDTWTAFQARKALAIDWDFTAAETRSTDAIWADYKTLAQQAGAVAKQQGNAAEAIASSVQQIEAEFEFPYLAHAPMEPLDAIVELTADGVDIWAGSQFQTVEQNVAAAILGLKPEQVRIHTQWAGGSFGRRASPSADYIAEAVSVAKAINGRYPVQLVWSREDDIQGGFYRPMYYHKIRAGLDAQGKPVGWEHRIVGQSIIAGSLFEAFMVKNGVDATSVEGASTQPYAVPNILVDLHTTKSPIPVLWWRSVGHSHTAYAVEAFVDRLASAANQDPLAYRLSLLDGQPRLAKVLQLAADKADWGRPLPNGVARGIAVAESFSSAVAQVAEVKLNADGTVNVLRVVCAVDCGIAVNPDVVKAQMEGGIGYALSAIVHGGITLTDGVVDQSNFDGYAPLRLSEMPKVEVYVAPSNEHPTGVGEPGVPPLGPAVANALFALTGKPVGRLPI